MFPSLDLKYETLAYYRKNLSLSADSFAHPDDCLYCKQTMHNFDHAGSSIAYSFQGGKASEVKTTNDFCPSRFSKVCSDLHFIQIAFLDTHTDLCRFSQVFLHSYFL